MLIDIGESVESHFKNSAVHQKLTRHRIFKRLAKALIIVCVCAGWSEPLHIAHTTTLEISFCGAYMDLLDALYRNAPTSYN